MKLLDQTHPKYNCPQLLSLQEKLMKIHLYNEDEPREQVTTGLSEHIEPYIKAIDKVIELRNHFAEKTLEIKELKTLAAHVHRKTQYTEKIEKIIDEFCQDANLEQLQNEYKEASLEVARYRSLFSICKTMDILNRYMCFVCVENPVDHCLVPCGHVLCSRCASKIISTCPFCRSNFQTRVKMFLD